MEYAQMMGDRRAQWGVVARRAAMIIGTGIALSAANYLVDKLETPLSPTAPSIEEIPGLLRERGLNSERLPSYERRAGEEPLELKIEKNRYLI